MFFQSIPDDLIDVDTDWGWEEKSEFVPIILPRDFLMLINYGIAESQGMPQISEDLLAAARLRIHMNGETKRGEITGKVVGFSHKISSILVPESFLKYSNDLYGNGNDKLPQRLFITIKEGSYGQLEELMEDMNLDINKTALDMTKIKTFVKVILSIFLLFSIIIILLSILGFMQYIQLILNKSRTEIIILLKQGYTYKTIINTLVKYFTKVFGIITALSLVFVIIIKKVIIDVYIKSNGVLIGDNDLIMAFLVAAVSVFLFLVTNFVITKTTLKKIGN